MLETPESAPVLLTPAQRAALDAVRTRAHARAGKLRLQREAEACGLPRLELELLLSRLSGQARVAVHFHPDRIARSGRTVVEGLLAEGCYRNQFETGLSNGSRTAFPGGDRDRWEAELFDGAYQQSGVMPKDRPVYGALELVRCADGPAPRFGSCYLRMRPEVSQRCTFTFGDSHQGPAQRGSLDTLHEVLAALFAQAREHGTALGLEPLTPPALLQQLLDTQVQPPPSARLLPVGRALDAYLEAQIHGPLILSRDVECLVVDPAFAGTRIGDQLQQLAKIQGFTLDWHHGFELEVEEIPADFRGPLMRPLAERICPSGRLNVATVGAAARQVLQQPEAWEDWGDPDSILQQLKQLWHVLVYCGRPLDLQRETKGEASTAPEAR